ncbi:MAG: Glu/Leu/Phe/Val family dehydrogenase [Actinomycetota bacterium]
MAGVLESLGSEYEQIVFAHEPDSGLRTIVAIHSTALGPALGGTRFYPFASEEAALADVLRLSKAMSYKNACAGLDCGGGKAVVIGDPRTDKTPDLLRAYGRVVDRLNGAYLTTADVGTNANDMVFVAESTRFVTGTPSGAGDPSPNTAYGVWSGMRAVAERAFGEATMAGRHVVVQGVGKVGGGVARLLAEEGARLTLSDVDAEAVSTLAKELEAGVVAPNEALSTECDVLAPCALGPVVTDATLGAFRCRAIAGAANNQLDRPDHGAALHAAGILYAPDYVLNAGGVINVAGEVMGFDAAEARERAAAIASTLRRVFERSEAERVTPAVAADRLAEERIFSARRRFGGPGGSR